MSRITSSTILALAFSLVLLPFVATPTLAGEPTMHSVLEHYESVRRVLVHDTVEATAADAKAIEQGLAALHRDFDPQAAAVHADSRDKALDLLAKMHTAATALAKATQAGDLPATRDAFYELSKPLVQYRELMTGERPVVAYCPMAKKSWLQQGEEIGNPYEGQSMPRCGSVVSRGR